MENFLIEQIIKIVSDIESYTNKIDEVHGQRRITEYLNIEHNIGKYHGFLECLEEINIEEFVRIHDLTHRKIDRALKKLETIYSYINRR